MPVGRSTQYGSRVDTVLWRALGILENETVTWFWIGSHAEYERMLSKH